MIKKSIINQRKEEGEEGEVEEGREGEGGGGKDNDNDNGRACNRDMDLAWLCHSM